MLGQGRAGLLSTADFMVKSARETYAGRKPGKQQQTSRGDRRVLKLLGQAVDPIDQRELLTAASENSVVTLKCAAAISSSSARLSTWAN